MFKFVYHTPINCRYMWTLIIFLYLLGCKDFLILKISIFLLLPYTYTYKYNQLKPTTILIKSL
jgi:hypothetical protein